MRRSGVMVMIGVGIVAAGCTTAVRPPAEVSDPVRVFLLDHGHTATLVLPEGDEAVVRWGYGDWNYYALGNRWLIPDGFFAMLVPTRGALGRKRIEGPPDSTTVARGVRVPADNTYEITVERERAEALLAALESEYQQEIETEVAHPEVDLNFVHHPRRYTYFYNSNNAVAGWLGDLGCELSGLHFNSSWRVVELTPDADER